MSMHYDPELNDILEDDELMRLAGMLRSTRRAEPPLDEAFRSELRRQLMKKAWEMGEGRTPWWRRLSGPPSFAWVGAAAGVVLIASVVVYMTNQPASRSDIHISSPMADARTVQLQQPILVKFNQPMDHKSTEAAVKIAPATYVAFSWNANTLAVQPTGGNLAPNTQYKVTIGPGARTLSGLKLASPTTITFVTQPTVTPPPPSPKPTVSPTPAAPLSEHKLAALVPGTIDTPQWSADSTTLYLVGDNGGLESVTVADGTVKVLVPDGVSHPAMAPAGDRLAYVRAGRIEVLTLATGSTTDLTAATRLTTLGWAKDQLLWGTSDGVFKTAADGTTQVAAIPQDAAVVSIAPDGATAVYRQGRWLYALNLASTKAIRFGVIGGEFLGWSPDGSRMLYAGTDATVVADDLGRRIARLPVGEPSWSSQDVILLGTETNLYAVRPDGFGFTKLSSGTYHLPVWAPNGTSFAYVRGAAMWSAAAPPLPAEPSAIDQASSVVSSFMTARLQGQTAQATAYLDDKGKQAYSNSGLPLVISGYAIFSRFYFLAQEITGSHQNTARIVVRLVLSRGSLDVSDYEETLILVRDQASHPFLINQATASPTRDLGKGAEVVSVDIASGSVKVVFDSDLVSSTVQDGVVVLDANGRRVAGASTYANRTVVITGLQLVPGTLYKLVVLTSVQDVGGRSVPFEYDLTIVGPSTSAGAGSTTGGQGSDGNPPSPEPTPTPTPSPVGSPTP
ncbi:MAG: Ig-like domain-containing protein [Candidatus Dormibacteraeota bacterium]|nr:Ig-like domain-containing protein [Candidatus Dormibacteraeota bacterium]